MAIQPINIGQTANDGTGDLLRAAFGKTNSNVAELDVRTAAAWKRAEEGVAAAHAAQLTGEVARQEAMHAQDTADGAQAKGEAAQRAAEQAQGTADLAQGNVATALVQLADKLDSLNPTYAGVMVGGAVALTSEAGQQPYMSLGHGAAPQWRLYRSEISGAEASSGGDFALGRYDDDGTNLGAVFVAERATGRLALGPSASAVDSSAALLVTGGLRARTWLIPGEMTLANLDTPTASLRGAIVFCPDAAGGASNVQCDGVQWLSLKTGLPAELAPEGGADSRRRWRRNPDGTLDAWGRHSVDMSGVVFTAGANGTGYYMITGSLDFGGAPFVGAPEGLVDGMDGQPAARGAYLNYYILNQAGISEMWLVTPMRTSVVLGGSYVIRYSVSGRWKP